MWRIVKLGGGRCKINVIPQRCGHGSVYHNTACENMRRPEPGATRCLEHRDEEVAGCAGHDIPGCKRCPPRWVPK